MLLANWMIFYPKWYPRKGTWWFISELPFREAAELGTEKVIKDHATIVIVITTDGSITDLSRSNYVNAEDKVISELKNINKPFIVIVNSSHPENVDIVNLSKSLNEKYNVPVMPMSIERMNEHDLIKVLKEALYEFPIEQTEFNVPDWVSTLKSNHPLKEEFLKKMKDSIINVDKLKDVKNIILNLESSNKIKNAFISSLDSSIGEVTITLEANEELYNDILKEIVGESINSKGDLIRLFTSYSEGKSEYSSIKDALKQTYQTGYGIVLPSVILNLIIQK